MDRAGWKIYFQTGMAAGISDLHSELKWNVSLRILFRKKILTIILKYVQLYLNFFHFKCWWNQDVKCFSVIHPHFIKEERFPQSAVVSLIFVTLQLCGLIIDLTNTYMLSHKETCNCHFISINGHCLWRPSLQVLIKHIPGCLWSLLRSNSLRKQDLSSLPLIAVMQMYLGKSVPYGYFLSYLQYCLSNGHCGFVLSFIESWFIC